MNVPAPNLAPWQVYSLIASVPAILLLGLSGVIWDMAKEWLETHRVRDLMAEAQREAAAEAVVAVAAPRRRRAKRPAVARRSLAIAKE